MCLCLVLVIHICLACILSFKISFVDLVTLCSLLKWICTGFSGLMLAEFSGSLLVSDMTFVEFNITLAVR